MRRLRLLTVLAICVLLGTTPGAGVARAGTFQQWSPTNDGLWGSDVTCLWQSSPGLLLVGTSREGIYATDNGGTGWRWSGSGLPNLGTSAEPAYPGVLFLDGTGTAGTIVAGTTHGLYVSRDAGASWGPAGGALASMPCYCIAVSPSNPSSLLAGTDDGVYASTDGGATWAATNADMRHIRVLSIVWDYSMERAVFACTGQGLFKSLDGGAGWHQLSSAMQGVVVQCLAQDPRRPGVLLVGTRTGLYRSYDGGDNWTPLRLGVALPSTIAIRIDSFDQALVGAITVSGVIQSTDGGETWQLVCQVGTPVTAGLLVSLGSPVRAVVGTSRGTVFITSGQADWRVTGQGLLDVTAAAYDVHYDVRYAVRGSSLYRSSHGSVWLAIEANLGNARAYGLTIDRNEPRVMYAATEYGILRSMDAGESWIQLAVTPSNPRGKIQAVAVDPADGRYVYAGNDYGLYRSDKGFSSGWTMVGPQDTGPIVGIAVVPMDGRTVYLASASTLWKTTDRCATWQVVTDQLSFLHILSLAVSDDGRTLYAGSVAGGLFSVDGGLRWQSLGPALQGLQVNSVVPGAGNELLAGTSGGFYVGRTTQDDVGPTVRIDSPANGTVISVPTVSIVGNASDGGSGLASLAINGTSVSVSASTGQFSAPVTLRAGNNAIVVRAVDIAGNVTEVPLTVVYQAPTIVLQLTVGSPVMRILPDRTAALDAPPVILSGRTLVAIRPIVEALGGTIDWSASDRKVTILQGEHTIQVWIDKNTGMVDGQSVPIDAASSSVAPKIINGRTMVPLRFVAEALGAQVEWDAGAKRITITYSGAA